VTDAIDASLGSTTIRTAVAAPLWVTARAAIRHTVLVFAWARRRPHALLTLRASTLGEAASSPGDAMAGAIDANFPNHANAGGTARQSGRPGRVFFRDVSKICRLGHVLHRGWSRCRASRPKEGAETNKDK
jgi:hypothetical protein